MLPVSDIYINLMVVREIKKPLSEAKQESKEEKPLGRSRDAKLSSQKDIFHTTNEKEIVSPEAIWEQTQLTGRQHPIIIAGDPGVGKSTFSHYIAYQWAANNLWPKLFDHLFWIKLSDLKSRYEKQTGEINLLDMIESCCLSGQIHFTDSQRYYLEKEIARDRIVWLLDGYDEISQTIIAHPTSALTILVKKLFQKRYILITSRRHAAVDLYIQLPYATRLELLGFNDDNIHAFVRKFFPNKSPNFYQNLLEYLQSSNISGLAHIPLNLELICRSWQPDKWEHSVCNLTTLYQRLNHWLLERHMRNHKITLGDGRRPQKNFEKLVKAIYVEEEALLAKIAYDAMEKSQEKIEKETLEKASAAQYPGDLEGQKWLCEQVLALGILRASSSHTPESDSGYYFCHLTFQEYYAALYIANSYNQDENDDIYKEILEFTNQHKYNQHYQIVWWFVAGILAKENSKGLTRFFNQLLQQPREIIPVMEPGLWLRCLDEAQIQETTEETQPIFNALNNFIESIRKVMLPIGSVSFTQLNTINHYQGYWKKLLAMSAEPINQPTILRPRLEDLKENIKLDDSSKPNRSYLISRRFEDTWHLLTEENAAEVLKLFMPKDSHQPPLKIGWLKKLPLQLAIQQAQTNEDADLINSIKRNYESGKKELKPVQNLCELFPYLKQEQISPAVTLLLDVLHKEDDRDLYPDIILTLDENWHHLDPELQNNIVETLSDTLKREAKITLDTTTPRIPSALKKPRLLPFPYTDSLETLFKILKGHEAKITLDTTTPRIPGVLEKLWPSDLTKRKTFGPLLNALINKKGNCQAILNSLNLQERLKKLPRYILDNNCLEMLIKMWTELPEHIKELIQTALLSQFILHPGYPNTIVITILKLWPYLNQEQRKQIFSFLSNKLNNSKDGEETHLKFANILFCLLFHLSKDQTEQLPDGITNDIKLYNKIINFLSKGQISQLLAELNSNQNPISLYCMLAEPLSELTFLDRGWEKKIYRIFYEIIDNKNLATELRCAAVTGLKNLLTKFPLSIERAQAQEMLNQLIRHVIQDDAENEKLMKKIVNELREFSHFLPLHLFGVFRKNIEEYYNKKDHKEDKLVFAKLAYFLPKSLSSKLVLNPWKSDYSRITECGVYTSAIHELRDFISELSIEKLELSGISIRINGSAPSHGIKHELQDFIKSLPTEKPCRVLIKILEVLLKNEDKEEGKGKNKKHEHDWVMAALSINQLISAYNHFYSSHFLRLRFCYFIMIALFEEQTSIIVDDHKLFLQSPQGRSEIGNELISSEKLGFLQKDLISVYKKEGVKSFPEPFTTKWLTKASTVSHPPTHEIKASKSPPPSTQIITPTTVNFGIVKPDEKKELIKKDKVSDGAHDQDPKSAQHDHTSTGISSGSQNSTAPSTKPNHPLSTFSSSSPSFPVLPPSYPISFFGKKLSLSSSNSSVNSLITLGDDTNILFHQSGFYFYSLRDVTTLIAQTRQQYLNYKINQHSLEEYKAQGGELYSSLRENDQGVFISDPYTIVDSHGLGVESQLSEDVSIITGEHENPSRRNRWTYMPDTLLIPFLKNSHWRLLRIQISYPFKKFSILFDDPYGGERFPQMLRDDILPIVKKQVMRLFSAQAVLHSETAIAPKPVPDAKDIPCDIYIKSKDQQGVGINGSNCGPIALQNLRDYVRLSRRSNEDFSPASCGLYTIPAATDITHPKIIKARREEDKRFCQEYYSSKTTTGAPTASSNERLKQQQAVIANTNQEHLDRVKDDKAVCSDFVEKISQLEPSILGVLFALIDHDRLCSSTNPQAPYTQQELERAFNVISEQQKESCSMATSKESNVSITLS